MLYTLLLGAACMIGSTMGATLTVQVGAGGQRVYEPSNIKAQLGDIVNFEFVGGNHTVTQSTFANPCTNSGFKSGFRPQGTATTFAIMVNSTKPIWVYCAQSGHCQAGMVMAINAANTGDKTFDAFKALAMGNPAGGSSPNSTTGGTPSGSGSGGQAGTPVSGGTPSGGSPSGVAASSGSATASSGSIPGSTSASGNAPSASASGGAGFTLASPALGMLSILLPQLGLL